MRCKVSITKHVPQHTEKKDHDKYSNKCKANLPKPCWVKPFWRSWNLKTDKKINKWNRTWITFSHTDKKVRHVMSHQPALAVVTCSFKKFSARRIIESIQTLILISFGANFFTSLSSLSPKPVKKEKLKLMMCCSSKFSLHLIPCFNFEPQNTQTQIFPSGLLGYLCLQHQCIIQ